MEKYFAPFRKNIVGIDQKFETIYGEKPLVYADWIASGRLYKPIEDRITTEIGPFIGNTHTETAITGTLMTKAYHEAQSAIKTHVNASNTDVLITAGFGMTAVINKLQRILGLRSCGMLIEKDCLQKSDRPVVFITHMEHHSNHTSWFESVADLVVVPPDDELLVSPDALRKELLKYSDRQVKIGSFIGSSNVTGIHNPVHALARVMHEFDGLCFVDYAAAAPYCDINMHPEDPMEKLDAIFFSPHKFLGGPGSSGVLIFDSVLYKNAIPDNPGGGTVDWTNPWGGYKYIDDIEVREDGGTPGFLQAMRTAMCISLKENMGTENICKRENEMNAKMFEGLAAINGLHNLADNITDRLGVHSFYIDGLHFNLVVKLLNDVFGIQVRGGCACAGTYGHYLLDVSYDRSKAITDRINSGDLSEKPGWIRLSLHPTHTDAEVDYMLDAIKDIAINGLNYAKDYQYIKKTNEFVHRKSVNKDDVLVKSWLKI